MTTFRHALMPWHLVVMELKYWTATLSCIAPWHAGIDQSEVMSLKLSPSVDHDGQTSAAVDVVGAPLAPIDACRSVTGNAVVYNAVEGQGRRLRRPRALPRSHCTTPAPIVARHDPHACTEVHC